MRAQWRTDRCATAEWRLLVGLILSWVFAGRLAGRELPLYRRLLCDASSQTERRRGHALRTAAGRRGCNRRVSWPPSLSLGRSTTEMRKLIQIIVVLCGVAEPPLAGGVIPGARIAPMQQEVARIGFTNHVPATLGALYHYSLATNHYSNATISVAAQVRIFGSSTNEVTCVEAEVSSPDARTLKEYAQQFLGYVSMLKFDRSDVNVRGWVEINVKQSTASEIVAGVEFKLTTPSLNTKMIRITKVEPATPPLGADNGTNRTSCLIRIDCANKSYKLKYNAGEVIQTILLK